MNEPGRAGFRRCWAAEIAGPHQEQGYGGCTSRQSVRLRRVAPYSNAFEVLLWGVHRRILALGWRNAEIVLPGSTPATAGGTGKGQMDRRH